ANDRLGSVRQMSVYVGGTTRNPPRDLLVCKPRPAACHGNLAPWVPALKSARLLLLGTVAADPERWQWAAIARECAAALRPADQIRSASCRTRRIPRQAPCRVRRRAHVRRGQ